MEPVEIQAGKLTVGVAAHGNVEITIACVNAILFAMRGEFDLILVDDDSPDDMLAFFREVAAHHPRTRIFHFPQNKEYTHSVNCILNHAQTELVLFVSNDVIITPAYVRAMLELMEDTSIGIARGVSNFVDDTGSSLRNIAVPEGIDTIEDVERLAEEVYNSDRPAATADPSLIGDIFITRRRLIEEIGGFDTRFVGYYGDTDFGIRAEHAGYRKVVCGKAFAWHVKDVNFTYLDASAREQKFQRRLARVAAAWSAFREKWALEQLSETWSLTVMQSIPYGALNQLPMQPERDVMAAVDYSGYELSLTMPKA